MPKMITDTRAGAYMMARSDIVPGADNRDAIQAIITAAAASTGIRRIILPPGEITLGAQLAIPATGHNLVIEGHGDDTVIKQVTGAVNKALFYGAGTDGTKTALAGDLTAGSTTLTIPTEVASTLAVGNLLGLEATTIVYGLGSAGQEAYASEFRKVLAVAGTTVTIDGPLLHDYAVSAAAVAWKVNTLNGVQLKNFVITSTDAVNIKARGILFEKARGVRIAGVRLRDSGGGIYLMDTYDAHLADIEADGLPNVSNHLGYGVVSGGRSAHHYIENLRGRGVRHLFTTLADERVAGTTTQWGGPRSVTIRGGVGEQQRSGTQYSIWDTHPYGTDIVFDQCRAFGGSSSSGNGFQVRAKNVKLINPVALYSGNNGIRVDSTTAENTEIVGGEVANAAAAGIGMAKGTSVRGTYVHNNTQAGIGFGATAINARISDCRIEDNQYGVHDQSAGEHTGIVVQGNSIPKSVTQTIAILSPKSNLAYVNNVVLGYGSGLDGVGGSPAGTIRKSGNVTDV